MKTAIKTLVISLALGLTGTAMADTGTLAKIKDSKSITLGVRDSSGLSFFDGKKYTGFHTEMAEAIVKDLRKQLGMSELTVHHQLVTSQNRMPLVQNGSVDLECGSTTNNNARQKEVSFAMTTFVEQTGVAVRADSGIKSIKDLNGKNVVATAGTTSITNMRKLERAQGIDFKESIGKDHAESWLSLSTGRADAFVMDKSILAANRAKDKNAKDFVILDESITTEPIACMIRKDDPAFQKAVNDSIKRQIADGSLKVMYDKWFMSPVAPSNTSLNMPLSKATAEAWANPNDKPMEAYTTK